MDTTNSDTPDKYESGERHFDASVLLAWRMGLEGIGISSSPLLQAAGLPENAGFRDERFALSALNRMLRELERVHGQRPWGVLVAEQSSVFMLGLLGMLARNSATVGDLLARVSRFRGLVQEVYTTVLVRADDVIIVRAAYNVPETQLERALIEYGPASAIVAMRTLVGDATAIPLRVSFRHGGAPADAEVIARVFGKNVVFNAAKDEVVFPREVFERPIVGAIPSLLPALDSHAADIVAALPPVGSFTTVVRAQIGKMLSDGEPTLQALAKRLGMSARTLQRRLANEGASVRELTETTRHHMAIEMLLRSAHSLAQIAFMTGFSDHSGFHRAFVRWEGVTPGEFRKVGRERSDG